MNYVLDELAQGVAEANDELHEMYGDKEARWFQIAARNATENALENGAMRILIVQPTGAGKTVTSGLIFSSDVIRRQLGVEDGEPLRLLFIADKQRLLTQAERAYADAHNVEFISQSCHSDIPQDVLDKGWHVSCLDEAHHEAMVTIQYQLEHIGDVPLIGLTATPDRPDGCLIKFDTIIEPITRQQAVEEGYLAETYINTFVDTGKKDKVPVVSDILRNYSHEMGGTLIFMRTKAECKVVATLLQDMGYNAVALLDQTANELDIILDEFSEGKYQFIVNCNRISEGVDLVGCSDVLLGRQFGSYTQLNQAVGRASRPDSNCNIWELINPVSGTNLDTTVVVGTPARHRLISKRANQFVEREFDYSAMDGVMNSTATSFTF